MKRFLILLGLILPLIAANPLMAAEAVGVQTIVVPSALRGKDVSVTVWYPAQAGGQILEVGENRLFKGSPAFANAPMAPGHFPLIVVSHGSGGRIEGLGWIASRLAKAGFIVAGPNHPGTTSGDSTPADTPKIWERTSDLSMIITTLTEKAEWADAIDKNRIGVLGFSLGGAAALELVGARAKLDDYVQYCEDDKSAPDCSWFSGGRAYVGGEPVSVDKFDLRSVDKERFEQSNLDTRVSAAVIVDPALAQAFDETSIKAIQANVAFINLGKPGDVPAGVFSGKLSKMVPGSSFVAVEGAIHFSFLEPPRVCRRLQLPNRMEPS